jgi:hypothetical protein
MADRRRGELKQLKKDSNAQRDILDELGSEITQDRSEPQYSQPEPRSGPR